MSSVFKRETKNFTFSLRNDDVFTICINDDAVSDSALEKDITVGDSNIRFFTLRFKTIAKIEITNFFETMLSPSASLLPQYVLSAFREHFLPREDQREQLLEGLRYFVHAKHYKLLDQADPKPLLEKYKLDYIKFRERYPAFLEEHDKMVEQARILHLTDPLVASTGLIVYSTLNCNWYIYETPEKVPNAPEYFYAVDSRSQNLFYTDVFKGCQKECINFVMQQQEKLYNISFEQVLKKKQENEALRIMIMEMEIVTNVPSKDRLEVQEAAKLQKEQEEANLDQNLTRLDAYATITT